MSEARTLNGVPGLRFRPLTETERNWLSAVAIVACTVAVFGAVYGLEMSAGRWNGDIRLVASPTEAATRYVGMSHFLIATLFLATSRRMRTARSWGSFAALLGLGIFFCVAYSRVYAFNPTLARIFFFGYFILHEMRDEVFFYFANGDASSSGNPESLRRVLAWSPVLLLSSAAALIAGAGGSGLIRDERLEAALSGVPGLARLLLAAVPAAVAVVAAVSIRKNWNESAGARAFLRFNRPIYIIIVSTTVVLFSGLAYPIVMLHVAAWYVFSLRQLARRTPPSAPPRPGTWTWLRSTSAGFRLLHIGSAVLLLAAGAIWAYGFQNDPSLKPLSILLGRDSFQYWTIIHVTLSLSH